MFNYFDNPAKGHCHSCSEIRKQTQRAEVTFPRLHSSYSYSWTQVQVCLILPDTFFHLPKGIPHFQPIAVLMATIILQNLSKGLNSKVPRAVLTGKNITKGNIILCYFFGQIFQIGKITCIYGIRCSNYRKVQRRNKNQS